MSEPTIIWIFYFLGAGLLLLCKLIKYLHNSKDFGKTAKQSLVEWFFDPTAANASSWIGTIGIVWICGYLYVNSIIDAAGMFGSVIKTIPVAAPIAFFLGWLAEYLAPNILKKITEKVMKALS